LEGEIENLKIRSEEHFYYFIVLEDRLESEIFFFKIGGVDVMSAYLETKQKGSFIPLFFSFAMMTR